jgi:hypothetical protein
MNATLASLRSTAIMLRVWGNLEQSEYKAIMIELQRIVDRLTTAERRARQRDRQKKKARLLPFQPGRPVRGEATRRKAAPRSSASVNSVVRPA